MAGRDLIVAEAEDIAEVAFLDAVDLGADGQRRAGRPPQHLTRDAAKGALEQTHGDTAIDCVGGLGIPGQRQARDRRAFIALIHAPVGTHARHAVLVIVAVQRLVFLDGHVAGGFLLLVAEGALADAAGQDQAGHQLVFGLELGADLIAEGLVRVEERGRKIGFQRPAEAREHARRAHQIARARIGIGQHRDIGDLAGLGVFQPLDIRAAQRDRGGRQPVLGRGDDQRLDRGRQGARHQPRGAADGLGALHVAVVADADLGAVGVQRHRFEHLTLIGQGVAQ